MGRRKKKIAEMIELRSIHDQLFKELEAAIEKNEDMQLAVCSIEYLNFIAEHGEEFGFTPDDIAQRQKHARDFYEKCLASEKAAAEAEKAARAAEESAKVLGAALWYWQRKLHCAPPQIRTSREYQKTSRFIAGMRETYNSFFKGIRPDSALRHFNFRLEFYKKMLADGDRFALSAEKIAVLEKAIKEFEQVYETERMENKLHWEMLVSAYEIKRIIKLFDEMDGVSQATNAAKVKRGN